MRSISYRYGGRVHAVCTQSRRGIGHRCAPGKGNSKHVFLASPAEDIALIFLGSDVSGVTPAPVADAGYLDGLDLTSETFTVVGYGTDEFVTGSAFAPHAITVFDGVRSYRDVTVITTHDAFPDRFLKITAGVCFGDSGGPLFHGDTVVALNTWTFCRRMGFPSASAPAATGRTWSTAWTPRRRRNSSTRTCDL